jgi:hypothetical protein
LDALAIQISPLFRMDEAGGGLVRDLMLDLDRIGASEWGGCKTKRAVVPASLRGQTIHHGFNRNLKHVTIVPCVAASGEYLTAYVLISRDSKSRRAYLQKLGIKSDVHLTVQRSHRADGNGKIFAKDITSVFVPDMAKVRSEREIEQKEAALLIDNCAGHFISEVMDMFTTARVGIVAFVLYTRQILQFLDLTLFGTFKRVGKYHWPFNNLRSTFRFIYRLYMNFKKR